MILQISIWQIIPSIALVVILLGIIQWLLSLWIRARLEKSIQHEYDKKFEDYRTEELHRRKAEMVAKFFAKWIKYRGKEFEILEKDKLFDYYEDLNKMSFELSLWINDEKLLRKIMKRFNNANDALEIRDILIETRKYLLKKDIN